MQTAAPPSADLIPAFVNRKSGGAEAGRKALEECGRFAIQEMEPEALRDAITAAIAGGAKRIVISGGDGSIRTAASVVAGKPVELGIIPGGTLNHFAKDHGIPEDPKEAAELAATGTCAVADLGWCNNRVFLNTFSVGAYVRFVKLRDHFEPRFGYWVASLFAGVQLLRWPPRILLEMTVEGTARTYRTPVIFAGVGERETKMPKLGNRVENGRSALHLLVVRGWTRAAWLTGAFIAAARGIHWVARTPHIDAFMVDSCHIRLPRRSGPIALDGEIITEKGELTLSIARGALNIVVPAEREG